MTSRSSQDNKEVAFVNGAAEAAYKGLPDAVRDMADASLVALQNGAELPPGRLDSLRGAGLSGIDEIRIPYSSDTYRVYHVAVYREVIFVLDAGMKKSHHKGEIPREQVERLQKRLKQAETAYTAGRDILRKRFDDREALRNTLRNIRKANLK